MLGAATASGMAYWLRMSRSRDPEYGQVDGDHDRLIPVRGGRSDELVGHAPIAEDVELEPALARRGRVGDLGRAGRRQRREAEERVRGGGGAGRRLVSPSG